VGRVGKNTLGGIKGGSQENRRFFWVLKGGEVDK
jgi:hypothetical protein